MFKFSSFQAIYENMTLQISYLYLRGLLMSNALVENLNFYTYLAELDYGNLERQLNIIHRKMGTTPNEVLVHRKENVFTSDPRQKFMGTKIWTFLSYLLHSSDKGYLA